jgi:anti-sigma regulatory factor (Ser/Thr protein kinase)
LEDRTPPPLTLPYTLDAPALARQYLRTYASHLPAADLEDAMLLTSELVTNAVEHGRPTIVLRANFEPPCVTVDVADDGEGEPWIRPVVSRDQTGGRGMQIVDSLSTCWGITRHPDDGKSVWFQIHE